MIQAEQFDLKTGKQIQIAVEGRWQPAFKQIEHSYLEHWCQVNGIETAGLFSVAQFYDVVRDADRRQLEAEGKYLVASSGSEGLFTDYETAQLMTLGSETVEPIYAGDRNAAHNAVAYGSLMTSDAKASTTFSSARILIVDDENRAQGDTPLMDSNGQAVTIHQLAHLYDKMGDGTMLVSAPTMRSLQTVEEKEQIALAAMDRTGISGDLSTLTQDITQTDTALEAAERKEIALSRQSVYQFRAASPSLPGIAKGTMTSSQWCDRLGVDAIISLNDIKGSDERFSQLGVQEVSDFWINRKAVGKYGQQTVGPQVKNTIPTATRDEINPRVKAAAVELAEVAGDYDALSQRYVEHKARERERPYQSNEDNIASDSRPEWLYSAIVSDSYGVLNSEAHLVRGLEYYIQGEWQRLATNGTSVPSAMAQPHNKLRPWEVCNKDLPHGAIVAYYRSPFPNVGAAVIAINNKKVLEQQDEEAFAKQGVAYLHPEVAKEVAITDFDGDLNGFFVGYTATVDDLPEQLRRELEDVEGLPATQQYEYARDVFEGMLERHEQGGEPDIEPGEYPIAVKEFIQRTAPEVKPPQIKKQDKEKHSWQAGESHSEATWRAWSITADNPTGRVANAGMSLQSLSNELQYAPGREEREGLLHQVSKQFSQVLRRADLPEDHKYKVHIPREEWLDSQGFSGFYRERMEAIAGAGKKLGEYKDPEERTAFIDKTLSRASAFLSDVANGPGSVNLQTAVDTAKSARGIDETVHRFMAALRYEKDALRSNKNNGAIYTRDKDNNPTEMPTSLSEPVSWGAQLVNEQYAGVAIEESRNQEFQGVYPKYKDAARESQAKKIIDTSSHFHAQVKQSQRRSRGRRQEDQRPTIAVTTTQGRQLTFHNIEDAQGNFPWRGEGVQPNWSIDIRRDNSVNAFSHRYPAALNFIDAQGRPQTVPMGYLDQASVAQHGAELDQRFNKTASNQPVTIASPRLTMQVPWAQQNDVKMLRAEQSRYIEAALASPDWKDPQVHDQEMAIALWRQSVGGRKLSMQYFPEQLRDRIAERPAHMIIQRLQVNSAQAHRLIENGPHTIQFDRCEFESKHGPQMIPAASVLTRSGQPFLIGSVSSDTLTLPKRATYLATFEPDVKSSKILHMRIMDLPTVEQRPADVAALQAGRQYILLDHEFHESYGLREGSVVVTQTPSGSGEQVALQVGKQHPVNERFIARSAREPEGPQKPASRELIDHLLNTRPGGKDPWLVEVRPLGTYERERIQPLEAAVGEQVIADVAGLEGQAPQVSSTAQAVSGVAEVVAARRPNHQQIMDAMRSPQASIQSTSETGVMAALSRNPKLKQRLQRAEQTLAKRATANDAQQNKASEKQENKTVSNHQPKPRPQLKKRNQLAAKKGKSNSANKDGGIGY